MISRVRLKKIVKKLFRISIIHTLKMNFHYFSWGGVLHPYIIVFRGIKMLKMKGTIEIENPKIGCIKIGNPGVGIFDSKYERFIWENNGTIRIRGSASFGQGVRISNYGEIVIGDGFQITANSALICNERIVFGENVMISWNVLIMDSDFHKIFDINSENRINYPKPIIIGNHNWICCRSIILKGTRTNNNIIIAAGSIITGKIDDENAIISSGHKVLKAEVKWRI